MRPTVIIGNWKMNKSPNEAKSYVQRFIPFVEGCMTSVCLAVPHIYIEACAELCRQSSVQVGAQNVSEYANGAYTGEVSAQMVKEAKGAFSLVGHSERRRLFAESDDTLLRKVHLCLKHGLKVVFCFGETLAERQEGKTFSLLHSQIQNGLAGLSQEQMSHVMLAYEPVWAIGTGISATPEQAQEVHSACRALLQSVWGVDVAQKTPILYGGSVTEQSINELLSQSDVDGALVGGASLDPDVFGKIVRCKNR